MLHHLYHVLKKRVIVDNNRRNTTESRRLIIKIASHRIYRTRMRGCKLLDQVIGDSMGLLFLPHGGHSIVIREALNVAERWTHA